MTNTNFQNPNYKLYLAKSVLRDMLKPKAVGYFFTLPDGRLLKVGESEAMHRLDELDTLKENQP